MRGLATLVTVAASLVVAALLGPSAAWADDMVTVTLQNPTKPVQALECAPPGCVLQVLYQVTNQGFDPITLTFTQHADALHGDTANDVLKPGGFVGAHPCGFRLAPISPCDVIAEFIIFDADPDDAADPDTDPDFGLWLASITVDWTFAAGVGCPSYAKTCSGSTQSPFLRVDVLDDPFTPDGAPEPAAWGLLVVGLGLAGGRLRRRVRPILT